MPIEISNIKGLSNKQFVEKHAKPGCIGLVGADNPIDNSIKKAQKFITTDGKNSLWSHAFIFSGVRQDGQWWIIESDLEFYMKQTRLGVQENRAEKYYDIKAVPNFAILDFDLDERSQNKIIIEGLNLVTAKTRYSISEVFGALFNFKSKSGRGGVNKLAKDNSLFCSAMVQHCYGKINISLADKVSLKNLAPEDIADTKKSHTQYRIIRQG
ncbi:MAG TPA: hypothetical protein VN026_11895 [Bacteroidia bacterium]|jgi:hypothetical protein|nr:hypothetical protein [Bacteroidia bacterium]